MRMMGRLKEHETENVRLTAEVCREPAEGRYPEGGPQKITRPSRRREAVQQRIANKTVSVPRVCDLISIREIDCRPDGGLKNESAEIFNRLIRLTSNHRNWRFGLCFLWLRNIKPYGSNYRQVYRTYRVIYRGGELNRRIRCRQRRVREAPDPLAMPEAIDQCWSMEFVHDYLEGSCFFRWLIVIDYFNPRHLVSRWTLHCRQNG